MPDSDKGSAKIWTGVIYTDWLVVDFRWVGKDGVPVAMAMYNILFYLCHNPAGNDNFIFTKLSPFKYMSHRSHNYYFSLPKFMF